MSKEDKDLKDAAMKYADSTNPRTSPELKGGPCLSKSYDSFIAGAAYERTIWEEEDKSLRQLLEKAEVIFSRLDRSTLLNGPQRMWIREFLKEKNNK